VGIGWFMARRALAGLEMSPHGAPDRGRPPGERVPLGKGGDEIDQLAITFNRMLDRIQELVRASRR